MTKFVLDSTVPVPEEFAEIGESEDTRWQPYKLRGRKPCAEGKCLPQVGKCNYCGDIFPCPSGNCGHVDCADPSLIGLTCAGNGTQVPEFVSVVNAGKQPDRD